MIDTVPAATVFCRKKVVVLILRTWGAAGCMYRTATAIVDLEVEAAAAVGYRLETPLYPMDSGRFCLIADNSR